MSYREAIEDGIPIKSSAGHFSQGVTIHPATTAVSRFTLGRISAG